MESNSCGPVGARVEGASSSAGFTVSNPSENPISGEGSSQGLRPVPLVGPLLMPTILAAASYLLSSPLFRFEHGPQQQIQKMNEAMTATTTPATMPAMSPPFSDPSSFGAEFGVGGDLDDTGLGAGDVGTAIPPGAMVVGNAIFVVKSTFAPVSCPVVSVVESSAGCVDVRVSVSSVVG